MSARILRPLPRTPLPGIREVFVAFADRNSLPAREHTVAHDPRYYGAPAIGVERLLEILGSLAEGDTELSCHPGHAAGLSSSYTVEREQELRSLTDPRVRALIDELEIELIGWGEL